MSWRSGNSTRLRSQTGFAALENFADNEDINRAWDNIKEYIKTSDNESLGLYELKRNKPSFDEEFLLFLDQRKQD